MTDLKATFATLLEQTITAARLSGSKVQTLITQSQSLTAQNHDTEVVTTFYRINSGLLPASTGRISSLYVFDAIARSARKDADKEKEKGKAREGRGMTGLITKMEGVVDAWVMGMVDDGKGGVWVEGKDKIRKILDIWRKGSTFPSSTLDRLQNRIAAVDAGPSRLAAGSAGSNGHAGPSTTPPGTPPAPVFSPVLPPLSLPKADNIKTDLTALPPAASSIDTTNSASQNLPPEIQKLLGIQNAARNSPPAQAPPPQSTIDIATLLASVRPAPPPVPTALPKQPPVLATQPGLQGYAQQPPQANGGVSFALDPRQLAALASFIPAANTGQTPPQGSYPLPGNGGYSPPVHVPAYPPHDRHTYGTDNRGPPARGDDGQSSYRRPPGGGGGYNDSGPMSPGARFDGGRNGYRQEDRGPHNEGGWDRRDMPRDEGRSFDRSGPPRGRESGWGDRRSSRDGGGGPRNGSRSPNRSMHHGDRSTMGRGDNGYGRDGGGGDRGRRGGGGGGAHKRGRESMDYENDRDGGKPVVKKNYGGFKSQAGRFDPPPNTSAGQNQPNFPSTSSQPPPQAQGRAPLPPGREEGRSRAPLPPGRDMGDEGQSGTNGGQAGSESNKPNNYINDNQRNGAPNHTPGPIANPSPQTIQQSQPQLPISVPVQGPRLETFDLTSFNPMMPECWAALAVAWRGTVGTEPGQMELMGFLAGQGPVLPMTMQGGQGTGGGVGMDGVGVMGLGGHDGSVMSNMGYMGQQGNGY